MNCEVCNEEFDDTRNGLVVMTLHRIKHEVKE